MKLPEWFEKLVTWDPTSQTIRIVVPVGSVAVSGISEQLKAEVTKLSEALSEVVTWDEPSQTFRIEGPGGFVAVSIISESVEAESELVFGASVSQRGLDGSAVIARPSGELNGVRLQIKPTDSTEPEPEIEDPAQ